MSNTLHSSLFVRIIESARTSISVCLRHFLTTTTFVLVIGGDAISPLSTLTWSSITDCSRYLHPLVSCQLVHLVRVRLFPARRVTPPFSLEHSRLSTRPTPRSSTSRKSFSQTDTAPKFPARWAPFVKGVVDKRIWFVSGLHSAEFLPGRISPQGLTLLLGTVQPSSTSVRI